MDNSIKNVYDSVIARDPNQPEFHQAVEEVLVLVWLVLRSPVDHSTQFVRARLVQVQI